MEKLHKKIHKGRVSPLIKTQQKVVKGNFILVALQPTRLFKNQMDAAILAIKNQMKKEVKIFLRISTVLPVTKKPSEVRMGKGKGNIYNWMARIKSGSILLEIISNTPHLALQALNSAQSKLPIKTKILKKI